MQEQRAATKENVERKQARGPGEKDEEEEDVAPPPSDDEDDNEIPYNPKNLPLGWDGKVPDSLCLTLKFSLIIIFKKFLAYSLLALQTARSKYKLSVRNLR